MIKSLLSMKVFLTPDAVEALCQNQQNRATRNLEELAYKFLVLQKECLQLNQDLIATKAELEARKQSLKTEAELKEAVAKEIQELQQLNKRLTIQNERAQRLIEFLVNDNQLEL